MKNIFNLFNLICFLFVLVLTGSVSSNPPQSTTLTDPSLVSKEKQPFKYIPIDTDFWRQVEESESTGNFTNLVLIGSKQINNFGDETEEGFEGHLAVGMGLRNLKLYFAATKVFQKIIKKKLGTMLAQKALQELSLIAQNNAYDRLEIGDDLLITNEYGIIHPDLQNFVSYHLAFYNLINGYKKWADPEFNRIDAESYWGQKINYYKALSEVARGLPEAAEARLYNIISNPNSDSYLKTQSKLQLARLNFEKKDYGTASKLYEEIGMDIPFRDKGRILLELAWTKYYLRDYSKALGILIALKAPMFNPSLQPERYVLEMIMYKQLCYFEDVTKAANEFQSKFGPSIELIKKRGDVSKDPVLTSMAMLDWKLQYNANLINLIRNEFEEIREYNVEIYKDFKPILTAYELKDKELQQRLFLDMQNKLPDAADLVLDVEEQIKFLDYTARLDALRIVKQGEERDYKSEKISYIKFDKIYWPITEEFWIDEIDEIKVLIDSKCDGSLPSQPTNKDIIQKFGEEFE